MSKAGRKPILWAARSTRHGPLISDVKTPPRWWPCAGLHSMRETPPWKHSLMCPYSRNWEEFVRSLKKYVAPSQNFVYADREGNIGYISLRENPDPEKW